MTVQLDIKDLTLSRFLESSNTFEAWGMGCELVIGASDHEEMEWLALALLDAARKMGSRKAAELIAVLDRAEGVT